MPRGVTKAAANNKPRHDVKGKATRKNEASNSFVSDDNHGGPSNEVNKSQIVSDSRKSSKKHQQKRKSDGIGGSKAKKKLFEENIAEVTMAKFMEDGAELEIEVAGQSTDFTSEGEVTENEEITENETESDSEGEEPDSQNNNSSKYQ